MGTPHTLLQFLSSVVAVARTGYAAAPCNPARVFVTVSCHVVSIRRLGLRLPLDMRAHHYGVLHAEYRDWEWTKGKHPGNTLVFALSHPPTFTARGNPRQKESAAHYQTLVVQTPIHCPNKSYHGNWNHLL